MTARRERVALLDVNVLLALAWPNHQHHRAAHRWLASRRRSPWATCPLTELAFVRLSSNPSFTSLAVPPLEALALLQKLEEQPGHVSWTELPGVEGLSAFRLLGHRQVNDAYLVVVARHHGGVLATFDTAIAAHEGAREHVALIPEA